MSVKLMCPKTGEVEFTGKATVDVTLSYDVSDDGAVTISIASIGDVDVNEIKNISSTKGKVKIENLVQAMQSEISGKWYNIEDLVEAEIEDEANPGQTKTVIMSQEEYEAMSQPSIDEMNEEQVKELAKTQQEQLDSQAEQIAKLQEQMAKLMANMENKESKPAKAAPAKPKAKAEPKKEEAPVEEAPAVDSNIQAPGEDEVIYSDENDENTEEGHFEGFDDNNDTGIGEQFQDFEAPF